MGNDSHSELQYCSMLRSAARETEKGVANAIQYKEKKTKKKKNKSLLGVTRKPEIAWYFPKKLSSYFQTNQS